MKNLFNTSKGSLLALFCTLLLFSFIPAENESSSPDMVTADGVRKNIFTTSADTVGASDTLEAVVKLSESSVQAVAVELRCDRQSGTPDYTTTISRSLDGTYFSEAIKLDSVVTTSDTTIWLDTSAFYGTYLKVQLISASGAQKSRIYGYVKSW